MNEKPTITYIKNGKEKTIKYFLRNKYLKEIGEIQFTHDFIINEDISFIHFKNVKFTSEYMLELSWKNPNAVIILEDCYFDANRVTITPNWLKNAENEVKLINPIFNRKTYVYIEKINNIEITLSNEGEPINLDIRDCKKININSSKNLNDLHILDGKVNIKNLNDKKISKKVFVDELILEDSNITNFYLSTNDKLHLKRSIIEIKSKEKSYLNTEKLTLENSKIISDDTIEISRLKELIFKDRDNDTILDTSSYLQAENKIILGKRKLQRTNPNMPLIITNSSLEKDISIKRQELLYILKKLNNNLQNDINKQLQEKDILIQKEIDVLKEEQEEKLNKIIEERRKQIEKVVDYKIKEKNNKLEKQKRYLLTKKVNSYENKEGNNNE